MIKDILTPNLKSSSLGDKLSDKFLGTNRVNQIHTMNNYELQRAINVNKFNWNKEGMIQAGINPLANSGMLNWISSSQAQDEQNPSLGYLGDQVMEVIDMLNPIKQLKELKSFVKDLLKK